MTRTTRGRWGVRLALTAGLVGSGLSMPAFVASASVSASASASAAFAEVTPTVSTTAHAHGHDMAGMTGHDMAGMTHSPGMTHAHPTGSSAASPAHSHDMGNMTGHDMGDMGDMGDQGSHGSHGSHNTEASAGDGLDSPSHRIVLGGFGALNAGVLAAAAILRRRRPGRGVRPNRPAHPRSGGTTTGPTA